MAAETLTATRGAATFPVAAPAVAGVLCCAYGVYEKDANAFEDGDIFEMCRIPKGATVVGGWFYADDMDTGTETLDIDIGWAANGVDAADPDGFGNLGVLTGDAFAAGNVSPVAGLAYPFTGVLMTDGPKTFGAETVIQLEANAASNAGHTGTMSVVVYYVMS